VVFYIFWLAFVPKAAFSQTETMPEENAGTPAFRSEAERQYSLNDTEMSPGNNPAASGGSPVMYIFRMVIVLALVAGLIYLVVLFLRRLSRPRSEYNPHLRILASVHLGGGRYIHAVAVGTKAWLVGSGESGVQHIAEITDQEAVNAMVLTASMESAERSAGPVMNFQALLKRFSAPDTSPENRMESLRKRRERFKRF
jgi:flagellar protein FliO/FliZ